MRQHSGFDRQWALAYLAVAVLGCSGGPGAVVPADAAPVDRAQVSAWVSATLPSEKRLHRFKWLFQDERSSAGGRGSARIAPPDSLRFDVAGPFGSGAASAAVIGDHPLWAQPPDAVAKLVPNYPLLWAMFGVARLPENGDSLSGIVHGDVTAWRYAGNDRHHQLRAHGWKDEPACHRGSPCGTARRTRGDDARRKRCTAFREAGGPERAGQARPHIPLDRPS